MALKLVANYSKKIGLPEYSSHSFGVSVEVELTDLSQVEEETNRIYQLLQQSVDQEIQNVGFVPSKNTNHGTHNGTSNGRPYQSNGRQYNQQPNGDPPWNCTPGQRGFILRILSDNHMDKQVAQDLSLQLFNLPVPALNKMQASQLIEDLLVKAEKPPVKSRWRATSRQQAAA